ncbi:type II toxin-antitoxin system HicB family antitoxin [Bacillus sp. NPDC094106]|uniref:type II toxin-antitoxin system HicB family antitoxin n=1 Tax=Bacillus sp. NPDC094106 TaxID=3363949 RepID=UPI0038171DBA
MKKDYYVYPAILCRDEKDSKSYGIYFPDLLGCVSHAESLEEVLKMGREALGLHLSAMEEDGDEIPEPTLIENIDIQDDDSQISTTLIDVWMPPLRNKDTLVYKRKNVTLPSWLEEQAAKQDVNFSEMLVKALEEHLGYKDKKNTP